MSAPESTVFQFNFKIGNDLHNIYATSGGEAEELLDYWQESLLPKVASITQAASAVNHVANVVPLAPAAQQQRPVMAPPMQAAPPQDGHACACGLPMKLVPAGTSKATGKPYRAFWACAQPRGSQCDTRITAG